MTENGPAFCECFVCVHSEVPALFAVGRWLRADGCVLTVQSQDREAVRDAKLDEAMVRHPELKLKIPP